ncbi:MAG: phosphate signaling complex protein PhoU [Oscillospiraceae bacterium]|nr:phosphate signaling complex protein PhoU [Oscillospiraceae bacterium]
MRNRFDEQLSLLNHELLEMGALVESAIRSATTALVNQDVEAALASIAADKDVDQTERGIESLCLKLLLQQQPVARDLRLISSALKMITDMERIGDQASDISEIVIYLSSEPYIKQLEHLPLMAEKAIRMVTAALDAYVRKDVKLAQEVMEMDDEIDSLFTTVKDELITLIRGDAAAGSQAIDLLMIAKYYERIGDHAQNIAEWVEYALTGRHKGVFLT